jgi:hypothetical protein
MNPGFPPPNRAIGWYRFMLWMMPTCIALTTAYGFWWLTSVSRFRFHPDPALIGWMILNALATVGIGIFEARLRDQSEPPMLLGFKSRVILFFFLQLFIIPALSLALFFAACLFAG